MLVKRVVFETLYREVPEYAIEGMIVKEFYTTGIDPEYKRAGFRGLLLLQACT